jgi:hypothetical protein
MMLVGLVSVTAGCPGSSDGITPRVACEDLQANLCERIYACYTPGELAASGFPSNEAACVTQLQAHEGCANQTKDNICTGNLRYHPDQANLCVDEVSRLACSQVRDDSFSVTTFIPACGKVCSVD